MVETAVSAPLDLPVGPVRRHGIGWWGAGALVASEGALFAYLLFAYYYTGASAAAGWLLEPSPAMSSRCRIPCYCCCRASPLGGESRES